MSPKNKTFMLFFYFCTAIFASYFNVLLVTYYKKIMKEQNKYCNIILRQFIIELLEMYLSCPFYQNLSTPNCLKTENRANSNLYLQKSQTLILPVPSTSDIPNMNNKDDSGNRQCQLQHAPVLNIKSNQRQEHLSQGI